MSNQTLVPWSAHAEDEGEPGAVEHPGGCSAHGMFPVPARRYQPRLPHPLVWKVGVRAPRPGLSAAHSPPASSSVSHYGFSLNEAWAALQGGGSGCPAGPRPLPRQPQPLPVRFLRPAGPAHLLARPPRPPVPDRSFVAPALLLFFMHFLPIPAASRLRSSPFPLHRPGFPSRPPLSLRCSPALPRGASAASLRARKGPGLTRLRATVSPQDRPHTERDALRGAAPVPGAAARLRAERGRTPRAEPSRTRTPPRGTPRSRGRCPPPRSPPSRRRLLLAAVAAGGRAAL